MKIAVSSQDGNPDSPFQQRFGRSQFFLIYDQGQDRWDSVRNPAVRSRGGAGPQVVQLLGDQQVAAVISGRFGPNAYTALQAAGMEAYLGQHGTPRELIAAYQQGNLSRADGPSGPGHHG